MGSSQPALAYEDKLKMAGNWRQHDKTSLPGVIAFRKSRMLYVLCC